MMFDMDDISGVFQGKLLVARPSLLDPNFARTVVLLLAHSDQGALGLVLNRPTITSVASPLPEWEELASAPAVVFVGGPVSEGTICLAQVRSEVSVPGSGYLALQGTLGTVDLETDPVFVGPWIEQLRIFAGYAGWGAGQLESELESEAWWAFDASADDVFSGDPANLWKRVLRRQGGHLAVVSAYPPDPTLN
jgi:putative transcriptional regulator